MGAKQQAVSVPGAAAAHRAEGFGTFMSSR